jgi:hypothetical protein
MAPRRVTFGSQTPTISLISLNHADGCTVTQSLRLLLARDYECKRDNLGAGMAHARKA